MHHGGVVSVSGATVTTMASCDACVCPTPEGVSYDSVQGMLSTLHASNGGVDQRERYDSDDQWPRSTQCPGPRVWRTTAMNGVLYAASWRCRQRERHDGDNSGHLVRSVPSLRVWRTTSSARRGIRCM